MKALAQIDLQRTRNLLVPVPCARRRAETAAILAKRMVIVPQRPYQALAEPNPPGFRMVRNFVVDCGVRIIPALGGSP